jgi:hypothetical protein
MEVGGQLYTLATISHEKKPLKSSGQEAKFITKAENYKRVKQ